MGLFSFMKNAGAKLFTKKAKVSPEEANKAKATELRKVINDLGLKVDYLNIEVDDDKVTVSGVAANRAEKEKVILAIGNVEGIATVDDQLEITIPKPADDVTINIGDVKNVNNITTDQAVFYEVQKGDSLSKIAKAHYGNAMKYPVIFEANKPMLKDPNLIYPGQMLRIPPLDEQA